MHIIARRTLKEKAKAHGDCMTQVLAWHGLVEKASWSHLTDVKINFPSADLVGDKTVFNIKGNHYRLIVYIDYRRQKVYIRDLLTHADYDKGEWKT